MMINSVNMLDLIFCITNTGDLISNEITNHHKKVAYLSLKIAEQYGINKSKLCKIFIAGLLHDIGAFSMSDRLELIENEPQHANDHGFIGAKLIEEFEPLHDVADMIRFHHVPWLDGEGSTFQDMKVPIVSHILHLADRVVVLIDKDKEVIGQIDGYAGV